MNTEHVTPEGRLLGEALNQRSAVRMAREFRRQGTPCRVYRISLLFTVPGRGIKTSIRYEIRSKEQSS
jgi:hypothetical protein